MIRSASLLRLYFLRLYFLRVYCDYNYDYGYDFQQQQAAQAAYVLRVYEFIVIIRSASLL